MHTRVANHILQNLSKIQTSSGKLSTTRINSKDNKELKQAIYEITNFLPHNRSVAERIYCIQNGITSIPVCNITGDPLKWSPIHSKYSQSRKAGYKNRVQNLDSIKNRYKTISTTLREKFTAGDYNVVDPIPIIATFSHNIKPWDIEKKYDFFCTVLMLTKFLPLNSKWGERFYCIQNKINERIRSIDGGFAKYINSHKGYSKFSTKTSKHQHDINYIKEEVSKQFTILSDVINIKEQKSITIKCNKCDTVKEQLFICGLWQDICCRVCTGSGRSKAEDEIIEFLKPFNLNILKNTTVGGVEIDILIPDKNIGIEYSGILWHSCGSTYPSNLDIEIKHTNKHKLKNDICVHHNINLINIFDSEWNLKQNIVKSILLSKLGLLPNRVFARKCNIRILTKEEKKEFYILNHIQGNCQSFIDYGLIFNDEIVAAMSFSRRKITKNTEPELVRFCCKLNTNVVGGFSKLLKRAVDDIQTDIISYCDLRYSDGKAYQQNGFILTGTSKPNYFYTKDNIKLHSRLLFQKHKLKNFPNYANSKSESTIMYEAGWRKIYDCGNLVFRLSYKSTKRYK